MRSGSASHRPEQSPKGDVTGAVGMPPMVARPFDDKPSDTLVVGFGRRFWTGSSTLPHLHQTMLRRWRRPGRAGAIVLSPRAGGTQGLASEGTAARGGLSSSPRCRCRAADAAVGVWTAHAGYDG